jgi:hypothetical protein
MLGKPRPTTLLTGLIMLGLGVVLGLTASAEGAAEPRPLQAEEEAALAAVQVFFDGLGEGPEALRKTLIPEGPVSRFRVSEEGANWEFLSFDQMMSTMGERRILERMWDATVLVRGPIAQVWTPYDLYVDGEFSHCGIDSFNLVKTDDGWTVAGVAFTVERSGCPPSPLGTPR